MAAQRWTVDDIMAFDPCWTRERVKEAFGGRRSLKLGELLDAARDAGELYWMIRRVIPVSWDGWCASRGRCPGHFLCIEAFAAWAKENYE